MLSIPMGRRAKNGLILGVLASLIGLAALGLSASLRSAAQEQGANVGGEGYGGLERAAESRRGGIRLRDEP